MIRLVFTVHNDTWHAKYWKHHILNIGVMRSNSILLSTKLHHILKVHYDEYLCIKSYFLDLILFKSKKNFYIITHFLSKGVIILFKVKNIKNQQCFQIIIKYISNWHIFLKMKLCLSHLIYRAVLWMFLHLDFF